MVKGNGASAFSAATAGTDYSAGTSGLSTGILKSTATTGALSIAVAADFPTLNQDTTGNAASATDATNVYITAQQNNQTYPIMLSNSTVTAFQSPTFDPDLQYNPFTDVFSVPGSISTTVFTSTASTGTAPLVVASTTQVDNLTAQNATNAANIAVASTVVNAPFYITLASATSGNQAIDVDSGFTLNPSTGTLTVPGTITLTSGTVTNLTAPSAASDAATKAYVDAAVTNVNIHAAAEAATTANLNATYVAGSAGGSPDTGAGVGATLTNADTQASFATDSYTTHVGSRVLVKNQTITSQNGVYVVTVQGSGSTNWVLTRASDYDNNVYGSAGAGNFTFIQEGTTQAATSWVQTSVGTQSPKDVTKIGTDAISFTQFSGAGTYLAGTGLSLTGTTFANTGVLSITSNTGLSTNTSATGNVTLTNTGVTSLVAGTNVSLSGSTGAVTINVNGTVSTATTASNLAGTTQYSVPYQSGSATTLYVSPGTAGSVFVTNSTGSAPAWSTTPTITGTNFTGIPNGALSNSSITIGSTSVSLGGTAATIAGLTLTAPALGTPTAIVLTNATGTAASLTAGAATNLAGGTANQIPYQTGAGATSFFSAANYGVQIYGSTGSPLSLAGAAGVLQGSASANPTFTTTPTLTGTNFTGTATSLSIGGSAPAGSLTGTTLASNVVTSSLTSVGTIGTGVWQGSLITGTYGGTGVNNGSSTITLAGNFVTSGAFATTLTTTGTTNVTLPTSGTLATTANINTALPSATTSQLYGGSGGAGVANAVTVGSGLSLSGGTLTSTGSGGTVTTASVVSANGFTGTVATATSTPAITISTSVTGMLRGNGTAISAGTAGTDYVVPATATTFTATQTFNGSSSTTAMKVANVTETVNIVTAAPSATQTFYVAHGAVQLYTVAAANTWTVNFGFSSGTTMNTEMAVGDSITVCMLTTQGATPYYVTAVQIDGTPVSVNWSGGTAPTAGHASGIDAYNFSIIKTASATYTVLGSLTQF
jgi:hypothetical protein